MKRNKMLLCFSLVLMLLSCKEDNNKHSDVLSDQANFEKKKILFFEFPDTVVMNKLTPGKLRYNTSLKNSDFDERYFFLHLETNQDKKDVSLKEMLEINDRSVYEDTIGDGWFSFQAIFTKSGESTLHCVVEDIIVWDNQLKGEKVKMNSMETIITKDVYVVQK